MKEDLIIYAAKQGAETARQLQKELDCRYISHSENRDVREIPRGTLVVCYGMGYYPDWALNKDVRFVNHPEDVGRKISKIWQIKRMREAGVPTLELTTSQAVATNWLKEGAAVLARSDAGKDGDGIEIIKPGKELPYARFYTKFFPSTYEFRVHVFNGKVIDIVQRKESGKRPVLSNEIRSWNNGWIFAHHFVVIDAAREALCKAALGAVRAVGLDFGGVDILYNQEGKVAVCEVNSAPGLVKDETIGAYVKAINEVYENK